MSWRVKRPGCSHRHRSFSVPNRSGKLGAVFRAQDLLFAFRPAPPRPLARHGGRRGASIIIFCAVPSLQAPPHDRRRPPPPACCLQPAASPPGLGQHLSHPRGALHAAARRGQGIDPAAAAGASPRGRLLPGNVSRRAPGAVAAECFCNQRWQAVAIDADVLTASCILCCHMHSNKAGEWAGRIHGYPVPAARWSQVQAAPAGRLGMLARLPRYDGLAGEDQAGRAEQRQCLPGPVLPARPLWGNAWHQRMHVLTS